MSTGHRLPRAAWPMFLTGALFLIYAGTFSGLSDGRILGNDAIGYAVELARGAPHANPHHLAFHPLAAGIQALLAPLEDANFPERSALGIAMTAQVLLSALGGALAALFFFRAARRALGEGRGANAAALVLTMALAFSAGHWLYASVGETYLPAIAAETALLGMALRERLGKGGGASGSRRLIAMVLVLLLAVLLRQDSVLVVLPVALLLSPRRGALTIAAAGALAIAVYVVTWLGADPGESFFVWLRGLANTGLWGAPVDMRNLAVGGTLALTALSYPLWYAGQGFLRGDVDPATASLLMGLLPWLLLVAGPLFGRKAKSNQIGAGHKRALFALVAFALLRFGFFAWWQPGNMEYHTGTLAPLFLALAVWLGASTRSKLHATAAWSFAAAAILAGNLTTLIAPNQSTALDENAIEALATAGPGGLVLSLDGLGHLALKRAIGTRAASEQPQIQDASAVASGADLTKLPELRAKIGQTLASGGRIVGVRDMILPARFDHALWPLDWTDSNHTGAMSRLVEGFTIKPIGTKAGPDSWLWTLELAPR